MMAARDALPVSEVLFLFFTGRGGSFLSRKEKEKNGGANRADKKDGHFVSGPARRKSLFAPLPSSFLNLNSPENCLIEREGGSLPPSLFPSDSVAKLRIIVF